jgi:glycosyltransferase involved in cell wall biosynthesis
MGKNKKNKSNKNSLPLVSLCTPTFNRRPFIPFMIKCFEHQTYPKDRIEWIIIDDGTDPIEELVKHIPQVKYFYNNEKMVLGKKRNFMHTKCSGDIIIYMDDDDYYPPERISHAVETLQNNPKFLMAGSSEMHIYFNSRNMVYQCGPYKENHATAATFAFRKELLSQTSYDNNNAVAEESKFTKGYNIPLIQLDSLKTILVFSHKHNSLNKEKLLEHPEQCKITASPYVIDDFVKDPILKQFYMNDMNNLLEQYDPGRPEHKPQLLEQIKKIEEERAKRLEEHNKMLQSQQQLLSLYNSNSRDIDSICRDYEKKLSDKNTLINELLKRIKQLTSEIDELHKSTKSTKSLETIESIE